MKIGLAGDGRAARTLAPLLEQAGHELVWRWSRAKGGSPSSLPAVDVALLAVSDEAIPEVAATLSQRPSAHQELWLHLSGALPSNVARCDHARPLAVGTMHPMVALPGAAARPGLLHGATCGVAGDELARGAARELATQLQMKAVEIDDDRRALYHAAAVSVAGHATALLAQASEMLERAGFEEPEARSALASLMSTALSNLEKGPPATQITGPVARGDARTVGLHLEALRDALPDALPSYLALARASLELSRGALSAESVQELEAQLSRFTP